MFTIPQLSEKSRFAKAFAAVAFLSATSSQAAILAQYNFESSSLAASQKDGSITATDISRNTGTTLGNNTSFVISGTNSSEGTGNLAMTFANIDDTAPPTGGAPSPDNITFTLTSAIAGQALNLGELTFFTRLNGANNPGAPGGFYTVQYDDLSDVAGFQLLSTFNQVDATSILRSIDLSGAAFDNLTAGITFRINFTEPAGATVINATNNSMKIDLITVNSVIPEPASAALFFTGSLLLLRRKRNA